MRMKHKTLNSFFKCFAYLPDSSLGPNINLGRAAAPARKTKGQQRKQRKGGEWEKNFIKHCNNNCYFHSAHTHTHHTHAHTHAQLKRKIYTHFTPVALHFSFAHQNCQQKLLCRKLKLVTGRSNLQRGGGGGGVLPPVLCAREIASGSASVACKQAENSLNSSNKFF